MYFYQFIVLAVLLALCLIKEKRNAAFIVLIANTIYFLFIIDLHAYYYYSICAALNLSVGVSLQNLQYRRLAIFSYLLVLAQIYGFGSWYNYYPPVSYDIICSILTIMQLIGIFPSGTFDRVRRIFIKSSLVKSTGFNRSQAYVKMPKNTSAKEAHK